ncbi:hypothetical protein PY650_14060 [Rhizobium calliandrae]|uniref:Transmembrane protein n=1 Tax=Rhizobium calliandrae TaxID=1312182 RepID=A0ABT7KDS6_9HYPH|nr:hypothetical protein [Rhizobium calliandrae]MDL2406767.1 hypothetical protein [Rhizobium calliandrae]
MARLTHPPHVFVRGIALPRPAILLSVFCLICALGLPAKAEAHSGSLSGSHTGIPIPSLSHGEMAVIVPYYGRIIALASSASDTDESFRRVLNFAQIQRAYCLWGIMPGSVGDEDSPFNECSHAYLAAAKMALLQMRTMKNEMVPAGDLVSEIDGALVRNNLSLILCRFSEEGFNTADLIRPRLTGIFLHVKSLAATLLALMTAGAALWWTARLLRTKPDTVN